MKLLVLSDSHGVLSTMEEAVRRAQPDQIVHLGDCWEHGRELALRFPGIPLEQVPGNCDRVPGAAKERVLEVEGHRMLICHGHTYEVKDSLLSAAYGAEQKKAEVLLFGHTHHPLTDYDDGLYILNPGSLSYGRPTYGLLDITEAGIVPHTVPLRS